MLSGVAAKQVVDKSARTVQDVNVAEVQNILTTEFNQIIHLPKPQPPPPPPADCPQYYNVSGAGLANWNGQYKRDTRPHVELRYLSTNSECSSCALYANGKTWRLAIEGKELFYVAAMPSSLPPSAAAQWHVGAAGKSPSPRLVAGPI
jgi:hypothetical protein